MLELTADTFHQAMADTKRVACVLHRGVFDRGAEVAALGAEDDDSPFTWTRIDVDAAPMIGTMFGVGDDEPHLILMRETVVLYCRPLSVAPVADVRAILDKAAQVDMELVRRKVAEERVGQDSLFNRRACPTTWRTR